MRNMNKDKILAALDTLKGNEIICYIYRESVFELLSTGRVDGTLYMMSDVSTDILKESLTKCGFKDVADGKPGYISARLAGQAVEMLCGDDLGASELTEVIRRDLSIHSMMMRGKGDIYDVFGGLDDFHNKRLRLTRDDVSDKDTFTNTCFELILKSGFTADTKLIEKLNKLLRDLPMGKRVSLIMMFRNYIKSGKADVEYILNVLSLNGIFPKSPKINPRKRKDLEEKLKTLRPMQNAALTCYLCGIKGEQLKNIPNTGFAREFYDCILKHIDDDLADSKQYTEAKNNCTKECFETLLAVKEILALLAGETFSMKPRAFGNLFKDIENSDGWRKENDAPKVPLQVVTQDKPKEEPSQEVKDTPKAIPKNDPSKETISEVVPEFEGTTEEKYIEDYEEPDTAPDENLPVRRPSENYYLQQK